MPTKKKTEVVEEAPEQVEVKPSECGHVNRHHYGTDGKLSPLSCDLPKNHIGDHHAFYTKNVGEQVNDQKGRVVKVDYHEEEAETTWGDLAGTPIEKIQVGDSEQLSLLQKDLILDLLNKNPRLTIKQASQQAKASPQWNAADLA